MRIELELLEECVKAARGKTYAGAQWKETRDNWGVNILSGYPLHLDDWRTGKVHPMTEQDAILTAKLVDVLYDRMVRGSVPGMPQDLPTQIQPIRAYRIGAENCRCGGSVPVDSMRVAEWIFRLEQVMGQRSALGVYVVNPLRIDGDTIDPALFKLPDSLWIFTSAACR